MRHRPRRRREHTSSERCVLRNERAFAKKRSSDSGARGREQSRGENQNQTRVANDRNARLARANHCAFGFRTFVVRLVHVLLAHPRARPRLGPDPGLRLVRLLVRVLLVVPLRRLRLRGFVLPQEKLTRGDEDLRARVRDVFPVRGEGALRGTRSELFGGPARGVRRSDEDQGEDAGGAGGARGRHGARRHVRAVRRRVFRHFRFRKEGARDEEPRVHHHRPARPRDLRRRRRRLGTSHGVRSR